MRKISLILVASLLVPSGASAAFPGDNGPVVYARDGSLYSSGPKGSNETKLTDGANAAWSPDGSRIAFSCDGQICVMDADGSNIEEVTTDPTFRSEHPSWSHDGTWIVFRRRQVPDVVSAPGRLFKIRPNGDELTDLDEDGNDPAWSPDGAAIVFTKGGQGRSVHAMEPDGTGVETLFNESRYVHGLTWSPDGKWIGFLLKNRDIWRVWKMRSDGSDPGEVFRGRGRRPKGEQPIREVAGHGLAWSPNGRSLLYVNLLKDSLCRISPAGTRRGCLGVSGKRPDWAPKTGS